MSGWDTPRRATPSRWKLQSFPAPDYGHDAPKAIGYQPSVHHPPNNQGAASRVDQIRGIHVPLGNAPGHARHGHRHRQHLALPAHRGLERGRHVPGRLGRLPAPLVGASTHHRVRDGEGNAEAAPVGSPSPRCSAPSSAGWVRGSPAWTATAIMFYYSGGHGLDDPLLLGLAHPRDPHCGPRRSSGTSFNGFAAGALSDARHRHEPRRLRRIERREGHRDGGALSDPQSLVILVIVLAVKAITLPGARPRRPGVPVHPRLQPSSRTMSRIWLEALTQNAWDTGAGWGLVS